MKKVLFACVGNSFRSQMAEGFAIAYAKRGTVDVRSGGTRPFGHVNSAAIRLMAEKGIDISKHSSKLIDLKFADTADAFVTLCGPVDDACPARIAKKAIDWDLPDPGGLGPREQVQVRDDIEQRVIALLKDWNVLRASVK